MASTAHADGANSTCAPIRASTCPIASELPKLSAQIVALLNRALNEAIHSDTFKARMEALGVSEVLVALTHERKMAAAFCVAVRA